MIHSRPTGCTDCENIDAVLSDIDCSIFALSKKLYLNITLGIDQGINECGYSTLFHLRRILVKKQTNPDYLSEVPLSVIMEKTKTTLKKI